MFQAIWVKLLRVLFGEAAGGATHTAPHQPATPTCAVAQSSKLTVRGEGRETMNAAYEKLCEHLTEKTVGFWANSDELSICTDLRGEVGMYRVYARVDADDNLFQVFGYSPVRVPPGARPAITETVARINHGLKVGKFEFDVDQGDLRFQAAQILVNDELDDATIERLIGTTMSMLNVYLPAVLSVIYGNELPKDAVSHAEPGRTESDEDQRGDA